MTSKCSLQAMLNECICHDEDLVIENEAMCNIWFDNSRHYQAFYQTNWLPCEDGHCKVRAQPEQRPPTMVVHPGGEGAKIENYTISSCIPLKGLECMVRVMGCWGCKGMSYGNMLL